MEGVKPQPMLRLVLGSSNDKMLLIVCLLWLFAKHFLLFLITLFFDNNKLYCFTIQLVVSLPLL